ncbi:hypothetical protein [Derxia gummosa]|uniref:Uncharacterized protein n=1 Tax=Derxia gummosa DSM 723 TaxID=1121388 RepID=A0A8B6XC15_9BURK|nr:hypothetical protein [Derxia gummosa]
MSKPHHDDDSLLDPLERAYLQVLWFSTVVFLLLCLARSGNSDELAALGADWLARLC